MSKQIQTHVSYLSRPVLFGPLLLSVAAVVSVWLANRGLPTNDEGALLTWAAKILRGEVFYREIDAYQFPGASYLLALLMHVFGEHLSVARALAGTVYCLIVAILYVTALQILDRQRAALFGLALLGLKFIATPAFTMCIYSNLAFCFGCGAIALLIGHSYQGPSIRVFGAGILIGLAITSKQDLGIYLGGSSALLLAFPRAVLGATFPSSRRRLPELAVLLAGLAIPILPMLIYFGTQGVLWEMIYSGLVRPFTGYLPTSSVSFFEPLKWWELGTLRDSPAFPFFISPLWEMLIRHQLPGEAWYGAYWVAGELFSRLFYTSVLVAPLWVLVFWIRSRREASVVADDQKLLAFALLSLSVTLSAFPRADFFHLITVFPVLLLLLYALVTRMTEGSPRAKSSRTRLLAELLAVSLFLAISGAISAVYHLEMDYRMKLAKAELYISPKHAWIESVVKFVRDEVTEDDVLFVYGNEAYYYFLADSYFPWPFAQLYPGQAGGDEGRNLVALLERVPPKVVIRGVLAWPGLPAVPSYAPILSFYLAIKFMPDRRVFQRYPVPEGILPRGWLIQVLQPRFDTEGQPTP